MTIIPPQSENELQQRAKNLAGRSVASLAEQLGVSLPENLRRDKGWLGQLLERLLGADAFSRQTPDFQHLGIELKTIPISRQGKPLESTFVTTVALLEIGSSTWKTSHVYQKLARVLWIPIVSDTDLPLAERVIAAPLLWSPSAEEEVILQNDWQELSDRIALGQLESITARQGVYLQVRPKGANAKSLCWGWNAEGEKVLTLPRGFYLRPCFTERLLKQHFRL